MVVRSRPRARNRSTNTGMTSPTGNHRSAARTRKWRRTWTSSVPLTACTVISQHDVLGRECVQVDDDPLRLRVVRGALLVGVPRDQLPHLTAKRREILGTQAKHQ